MFFSGISIDWVVPPPNVVQLGTYFNVSYRVHTEEDFFNSRQGFENTNKRYN